MFEMGLFYTNRHFNHLNRFVLDYVVHPDTCTCSVKSFNDKKENGNPKTFNAVTIPKRVFVFVRINLLFFTYNLFNHMIDLQCYKMKI